MVNIFSIITSLEPVDTVKNDRVGAKLNWVQNPYIYTRGGGIIMVADQKNKAVMVN